MRGRTLWAPLHYKISAVRCDWATSDCKLTAYLPPPIASDRAGGRSRAASTLRAHLTMEPAPIVNSAPTANAVRNTSSRKLGLLPLVCVMYLVVSGGAYGLEDAVRQAGPRLTILLCLIVPITLSLPTALMAAELTALMPVEGGFYFWVKEALGPFAGFAEAYLSILYTAVDMAIYPVLFAGYLSFIVPLGATAQIAIGIALVWLAGGLNLLGVRPG